MEGIRIDERLKERLRQRGTSGGAGRRDHHEQVKDRLKTQSRRSRTSTLEERLSDPLTDTQRRRSYRGSRRYGRRSRGPVKGLFYAAGFAIFLGSAVLGYNNSEDIAEKINQVTGRETFRTELDWVNEDRTFPHIPNYVDPNIIGNRDLYELNANGGEYGVSLMDQSVLNPFVFDTRMYDEISDYIAPNMDEREISIAIFDWIQDNIKYHTGGRPDQGIGYKNAIEVFEDRTGNCGEMAFFYVSMARSKGLESNFVTVDVDNSGESVAHASAGVYLDGELILVDPAYNTYDIQHQEFEVHNDAEVMFNFYHWR